MVDEQSELMTRAQVAELLQVNLSTLNRWAKQGTGPQLVYLQPRMPRYRRSDVSAFLSDLGPRPDQGSYPLP